MRTLFTTMAAIVLLLLQVDVSAQFQYRYATSLYDWPRALDSDNNKGYVTAGSILSGTWYPHLFRIDNTGSVLWSNLYNQPSKDEHFLDVTFTDWNDVINTFAAVGQADNDPSIGTGIDDYFLVVKDDGSPIIAMRYYTKETDIARHIEPIVHGKYGPGYVTAGYTLHNLSSQEKDVHVLITDGTGNLQQSAVFLLPRNQEATWVEPTKDGGFLLTGITDIAEPCDNVKTGIFVLRLDAYLNVMWDKTFDIVPEGGSSEDYAYTIKEDDAGEIQVAGTMRVYVGNSYDHDEPFQLHLKSNGTAVWLKSYFIDQFKSSEAVCLLDTHLEDGSIGYVLSGRTLEPYKFAFMFQTDFNGEYVWTRVYPPTFPESTNFAEDLTDNTLRGYSFTGRWFNGASPATSDDIHIAEATNYGKTDAPCEKEVRLHRIERRFCENRLNFHDYDKMSEVRVPVDPIGIDLRTYKCEDTSAKTGDLQGILTPNPSQDYVSISGSEGSEVLIYDMHGILKKKIAVKDADKISVVDLPSGLYVIKLVSPSGTITEFRFIKQ